MSPALNGTRGFSPCASATYQRRVFGNETKKVLVPNSNWVKLMDEAIEASDPRLEGVRPSQISIDTAMAMTAPDGNPPVLFENIFPATPSGKVELKSEALATRWGSGALFAEWGERATESVYPLMLISPASDKRISSTLGSIGGSRNWTLWRPSGASFVSP
jgi:hypothetical protein